jgi:hypothetical protein
MTMDERVADRLRRPFAENRRARISWHDSRQREHEECDPKEDRHGKEQSANDERCQSIGAS